MHEIETILKINRPPFLSTNIPNTGPNIKVNRVCNTPANYKAFPFIPIIAPNVLPVLTINEIAILIRKLIKDNLQNLKVLTTFFTFFFDSSFFNFFSYSVNSGVCFSSVFS